MKKTTNTSKDERLDWLFGGNPSAIENQEARGQQELVESQQLPRKCNSPRGVNASEQYARMGIKVFVPSKGDDLFIGVALPDGWKKEPTDHSMWNNLLDDKGRVRAMFFYKAAFYDRDSFVNFETRYQTWTDHSDPLLYTFTAKDTGNNNEIIFRSPSFSKDLLNTDSKLYFKLQDDCQKLCVYFLNTNFPLWQDINAYW